MKWFIALDGEAEKTPYADYARAAVRSAARNCPDLIPHLLWDGPLESPLVGWMKARGVEVWQCESSFKRQFLQLREECGYPANIASGAFLRVEIPEFLRQHDQDDHYVVYTDVDVIWCSSDGLREHKPSFCACSTEFHQQSWNVFNTGVMVMNVHNLGRTLPKFMEFCSKSLATLAAFDQGAYNEWYRNRITRLPVDWNWKPYWGQNAYTNIVHFHGPKPEDIRRLRENPDDPLVPDIYRVIYSGKEIPYGHFLKLWETYGKD